MKWMAFVVFWGVLVLAMFRKDKPTYSKKPYVYNQDDILIPFIIWRNHNDD